MPNALDQIMEVVLADPRRAVFAEGEEAAEVQAAVHLRNAGYRMPVLIEHEDAD